METDSPDARLVLVVERDKSTRDLQSFFLRRAGYRVELADDGQGALALAQRTPPSLVITEILIPKWTD